MVLAGAIQGGSVGVGRADEGHDSTEARSFRRQGVRRGGRLAAV